MKKLLKITGIIIITLLVIILAVPFLFQGKIMKIAKEQINTSLNAKADFGKLSLSLFKTFPNVSVGLKDFYIAGLGEFEGDTLVSFSSAEVVVDLISAIKTENIRIKRIVIDEPVVHAWVLPSGRVNWDIVKDTGEEQDTDTATSEMNIKIELKRFEINHANISYDDDS